MTWRLPLVKGDFMTHVSSYGPTLDSEETKDNFYSSLYSVIHCLNRNEKIVTMGDIDAGGRNKTLFGGTIGLPGTGNMNSNVLILLTLCAEHELVMTNTH